MIYLAISLGLAAIVVAILNLKKKPKNDCSFTVKIEKIN